MNLERFMSSAVISDVCFWNRTYGPMMSHMALSTSTSPGSDNITCVPRNPSCSLNPKVKSIDADKMFHPISNKDETLYLHLS